MARFLAVLALVAIVLGIAGLAVQTERSSAVDIGDIRSRLSFDCQRTVVPTEENGWKGEVDCSVTVDIPDRWTPPLPDTIKLDVVVTYEDVNQNGRPNRGDRLQCAVIDGQPGWPITFHVEYPRDCDPSVP